jgi:hypothetical protein
MVAKHHGRSRRRTMLRWQFRFLTGCGRPPDIASAVSVNAPYRQRCPENYGVQSSYPYWSNLYITASKTREASIAPAHVP